MIKYVEIYAKGDESIAKELQNGDKTNAGTDTNYQ